MLAKHLQQQAAACVEACYQQAEIHLGRRFSRPTVTFRQRGKIAGTARLQTNEIRLNPQLFADNSQEFLTQVIPHEVCHLLAWHCYGRVRPHGKEWQKLMTDIFQLPATIRHQMDTDKVAGQQFSYRCACQTHQLSIRRHNKVLRGQQQYLCRRCGTPLNADT